MLRASGSSAYFKAYSQSHCRWPVQCQCYPPAPPSSLSLFYFYFFYPKLHTLLEHLMHFLLLIYVRARQPVIYIRKQKSAFFRVKGLKVLEEEYLDCTEERRICPSVIRIMVVDNAGRSESVRPRSPMPSAVPWWRWDHSDAGRNCSPK